MIFILLLVVACLGTKLNTYQQKSSYYEIIKHKSLKQNKPVVYGYVYEYGTKHSVPASRILVDGIYDKVFKANNNFGMYKIIVEPGKHYFAAGGLSYSFFESKKVHLKIGDSVRINFYLKADTSRLDRNNKFN